MTTEERMERLEAEVARLKRLLAVEDESEDKIEAGFLRFRDRMRRAQRAEAQ